VRETQKVRSAVDVNTLLEIQYISSDHNESSFIAETSFVRAPLNSRVVSNNSAPKSKEKGKAKQETLDRVPLEVQEALILEDLLYVLLVRRCLPVAIQSDD
jgi:gamma-tubulin complex component 2